MFGTCVRDALGGAFFAFGNTATLVADAATRTALSDVFSDHMHTFVSTQPELSAGDDQARPGR